MFPRCEFSPPTAKATGLRVVTLSDTGVLARRIRLALNRWLKLLMNHLIFPMVNTFSRGRRGGGNSIITLSPNDQNSSLVCTCSSLLALSCLLNVKNFTSTPPSASSNELYKYHKKCSPECLSCPPCTYCIN